MSQIHTTLTGIGALTAAVFLVLKPGAPSIVAPRSGVVPIPAAHSPLPACGVMDEQIGPSPDSIRRSATILAPSQVKGFQTQSGHISAEATVDSLVTSTTSSPRAQTDGIHLNSLGPDEISSEIASTDSPSGLRLASGNPLDLSRQPSAEIPRGSPTTLVPAALIDIDHPALSQPDAQERLASISIEFTETLGQSGLDPQSPDYRTLWDRERVVADTRFRSMYGGQAWISHHIQSYHAQSGSPPP